MMQHSSHAGYLDTTRAPDTLEADVIIIGLGAGGSMALHDLARKGVDVLAIEAGAPYDHTTASRREEEMMPRLFMEGGARATEDMAIRILQGKGVGGSTLHNTNLCKRLPDELLAHWIDTYHLQELAGARLQQDFQDVETLLGVHRIPDDQVNTNNAIMARGLSRLGLEPGRLSHNRSGCKQSGFCELGCPNNGKQNAAKVLVPVALEHGARILTHTLVDRLHTQHGRISSLTATILAPGHPPRRVTVRGKHFILAASATGSAAIATGSGLHDPHRLAGTNLHMHPGAFVLGLFEEPVESWRGVPQSVDCTEFLSFSHNQGAPDQRVWLVAGGAHPGGSASMLPGFGAEHVRMMKRYPFAAAMIAMIHDHSSGRVLPGHQGEHVRIHYKLEQQDWRQIELGLRQGARIFLAAGAKEVILPLNPARVIRSERDLERFSIRDLRTFSPPLIAVHPMSTLWMGNDPRKSVVNAFGQHHHHPNLFVADGSLFPTSIGGPPQISIYTFGRHVARRVMAEL